MNVHNCFTSSTDSTLSLLLTYLFCFSQLVEAFHATLEEVVEADMLVVGFVTFLMSLVHPVSLSVT